MSRAKLHHFIPRFNDAIAYTTDDYVIANREDLKLIDGWGHGGMTLHPEGTP